MRGRLRVYTARAEVIRSHWPFSLFLKSGGRARNLKSRREGGPISLVPRHVNALQLASEQARCVCAAQSRVRTPPTLSIALPSPSTSCLMSEAPGAARRHAGTRRFFFGSIGIRSAHTFHSVAFANELNKAMSSRPCPPESDRSSAPRKKTRCATNDQNFRYAITGSRLALCFGPVIHLPRGNLGAVVKP